MTRAEQVKEIIASVALVDEPQVTDGALLYEDLGMDSLDLADLAMQIEDSNLVGCAEIDERAADWKTVQDVVKTVELMARDSGRR